MNEQNGQKEPRLKSVLDSISRTIIRSGDFIMNAKLHFLNTFFSQSCMTYKKSFQTQFYTPVAQFYQQLPSTISEAKINAISEYPLKVRFALVNVISLLAVVVTLRGWKRGQLLEKGLRGIRNGGIGYVAIGLAIAPQICNPLMKES